MKSRHLPLILMFMRLRLEKCHTAEYRFPVKGKTPLMKPEMIRPIRHVHHDDVMGKGGPATEICGVIYFLKLGWAWFLAPLF